MTPSQSLEAREVAVRRDQFAAVLNRQRGQVGVSHERPLDICAELDEEIPMPTSGRNQDGLWPLDQTLTERDRRLHWGRRVKDLAVRNDAKEAGEHDLRDGKRLVGLGERSKPCRIAMVLVCIFTVGVDQKVDVW